MAAIKVGNSLRMVKRAKVSVFGCRTLNFVLFFFGILVMKKKECFV